jgi:hypothetical protein
MTVNQQAFYKTYGVRNINDLAKPRLFDLVQFTFPFKSVLHYSTYDSIENGPPGDYSLFSQIKKPIYFKTVNEITAFNGSPRLQNINIQDLIRDYRNNNRRMKLLQGEIDSVTDATALTVLDYCILNKHYRYARNLFTDYHRWKNIFTTVIDTLVGSLTNPQLNHYLPLTIPEMIPSMNQLDAAARSLNQTNLKVFNDHNSFILLELWKWIDPATSEFSLFSKIPINRLHLVNLVYVKRNKWCVLNLGVLNSFRETTAANLAPENTPVILSKVKLQFKQIQKRILSMTMTIEAGSIVTVDIPEDLKLTRNAESQEQSQVDLYSQDDENQELPVASAPVEDKPLTDEELRIRQEKANQLLTIDDDDDEDIINEKIKLQDLELDQQLDQLNEINERKEKVLQEKENATIYDMLNEQEPELDKVIVNMCDRLADNNMLTAGEYKRFIRLAGSYKTIVAKDGKSTLEQYVKIPPEDLAIEDKINIPDSDAIVDKTMLRSSLEVFDKNYIGKDVIGKDIASMVMAIQKSGLIVTDYKVEKYESILGAEEEHTVRIVPVEGMPSTIRFKLPVVGEDGTYVANGVRYKNRRQFGDNPIRKIDFNRVSLTSYYGKTFVNRARKRANDYGVWLQNAVMAKALNKEDKDITELFTATVFDNTLKAPRAYTGLSMSFKSFKVKDYMLMLDHKLIEKMVDKKTLEQYEKDDSIICGYKNNDYLVMDKNNAIYRIKNNELEFISSIEDFLNIDSKNAPVEYAEVVIGAKDIPIGVVLSYYIGFSKLLKLLNLNPVRVEAGKRVSLQANEYSLVFSDETLIFSRDDRLASLIIGGFLEYHKTIRAFNVHSFDKRGVYVNLLESNKLGARYIREMDLMQQMFVDPITKEILQDMKEPTTFNGLLVRACELLLDDKHPEELDTKYMRIKGYERIPGAVYRQLVGAIRQHNAQLGKASKQVALPPYAVWKYITEDPTKVQISEINPIQALKETEAVTFSGTGGRNSRSMVKSTRAYHRNSMGTISESTVDSSDVGINIYTSANPQFKSLRGMSRPFDFKDQGATSLLSTSAMLAPASDKDD